MLELWEADGAFETLERHLARLREGEVADVYLGYGLSDELRRGGGPSPPEPCRLPLLACRIRTHPGPGAGPASFGLGPWGRSWSADAFAAAAEPVPPAVA